MTKRELIAALKKLQKEVEALKKQKDHGKKANDGTAKK